MDTNEQPPPPGKNWAHDSDAWRRRGVHHAELATATRVSFRKVDLGHLITDGTLPTELRQLAFAEFSPTNELGATGAIVDVIEKLPDEPSDEQLDQAQATIMELGEKIARLNRELCAHALVEPALTADELAEFPVEDIEMLSRILSGRQHVDAAGRVIGVAPLSAFEAFRDEHGCDPDCERCTSARGTVSTVDLADVV